MTPEQIQQILDGAWEDMTHIDLDDMQYECYGNGTKCLEDLQIILDQAREIERLRWALDAMVKACSQANLDSKWDQEIQAAIALLNPRANNEH